MQNLRSILWAPALAFGLASPALAQEEGGDDLDDILAPSGSQTSTVAEERREAEREAERGDTGETKVPDYRKKLIKTLQKKEFLKIGRFEFTPHLGYVANDPFVHRLLFGAGLGYHITEVFMFEIQGGGSPDLGTGDFKPITSQLTCANGADEDNCNSVAPEISRQTWHVVGQFNWSPFYGKISSKRSSIIFDLYATLGAGVVGTVDDLALIGQEDEDDALLTQFQVHPALALGGGLRVNFTKTVGLRFDVKSLSYIGTLQSTKLELKNNLTLQLGASVLFGRRSK